MSHTHPEGYFALPADGKGQPVLVLHAWWGLNDTIKSLCNRLAEEGYVAFAPDLYHGTVTDQISEAEKLVGAMDENFQQARAELITATKFLGQYTGGESGIAVIGFSMGAFYALDLAIQQPASVNAVVVFYGTGATGFTQSNTAFMGHFADSDPYEPQENVQELEEEIRNTGSSVTFHTYEGTGHWFFEPDRVDAYNKEAADLAWQRTLEFLKVAR